MDELIGRYWKRTVSESDERALCTWRQASERNERYYQELIHLLNLTAETDARDRVLIEPSAENLIQLAEYEGEDARPSAPRPFWRRRWGVPVLAAAAAIILLLGAGERFRHYLAPELRLGAAEFATGPSETATVTLGDGTVVRIAPSSRIRINYAQSRRDVFLVGKAYFAVAKMEEYPFRVRTRVGEVRALGTRFEVKAEDDLRVVVTEGRVAVGDGKTIVEVNAGEMSVVTGDSPSQPVKVDVGAMVAWVGGFLAFQSTPLRQVAAELEQEYGRRVILTDSALAELTVTGWYVDRSFKEIVTIICGVVGAKCSIKDGIATISR